jgi:tRNA pseudouridine65 synthase
MLAAPEPSRNREPHQDMTQTPAETLPILLEDAEVVAVHKPAGLLVHRSEIDRHERRFALQIVRDQIGRPVFPVHRLDKGTSGVLLFALDRAAARRLAEAFASGIVRKRYLAIVRGWPDEAGLIDSPLEPVHDARVHEGPANVKAALTRYTRLATVELPHRVDRYPASRYALLALEPATGRRHQLRRHLARISHPIIGDSTYGKAAHNRLFGRLFGSRRLLLACTMLEFPHPATGATTRIDAPLAEDFAHVMRAIGWSDVDCETPSLSPVSP